MRKSAKFFSLRIFNFQCRNSQTKSSFFSTPCDQQIPSYQALIIARTRRDKDKAIHLFFKKISFLDILLFMCHYQQFFQWENLMKTSQNPRGRTLLRFSPLIDPDDDIFAVRLEIEKGLLINFFRHEGLPRRTLRNESMERMEWIRHLARNKIPFWISIGNRTFKMVPISKTTFESEES